MKTSNTDRLVNGRRVLCLVLLLLLVVPSAQAGGDIDPDEATDAIGVILEEGVTCALNAVAVPVYSKTTSGWGFVLHQNPFGNVYASWYMTSEMSIGVDDYLFAVHATNRGGMATFVAQGPTEKSGTCKYVGNLHTGDFEFNVIGGGMGNQGGSSCTSESWWETTITAEVKVGVSGPQGSAKGEFVFGGSVSCTESSLYDSEVLIGETGNTNVPSWLPEIPWVGWSRA